jgi:alpha-ketoglutarate-dependent taurine dioxygenase
MAGRGCIGRVRTAVVSLAKVTLRRPRGWPTLERMLDVAAGVEPVRVDDARSAFSLLRERGSVILRTNGTSREDARALACAMLGTLAPVVPDPAPIKEGGGNADRAYEMPGGGGETVVKFQSGHTDGFAYGDRLPDFIVLLCVRPADAGGESLAVDTYRLLDTLAQSERPEDAAFYAFLTATPIEQTEPGFQSSLAPIVMTTPHGRRLVRWTPVQRPNPALPARAQEQHQLWIERWKALTHAASLRAPRFTLRAGDALCLDNYRMLHGRTGFDDVERSLWRVWAWTREALGVPDGMLFSDSRFAVTQ